MGTRMKSLPNVGSLKNEVVETIIKNLGMTKAAFFFREKLSQETDYLKIKDELFGDKTSAELYTEICEWKAEKVTKK
ncbi:hypothetical protein KsCSTR_02170 [Candidatus Kuenenia stuttgartiensis]|uniref:Uncharacterized protein n=1 Tax=Kuenenia stuttgartiensis TaxID=174633 RepID=A0A6G7GJ72_KUEST|nr:hypothetical protein [Candidatus Kuenenia stuttgartiensis]QII09596.1 hypothetical protein KsCSTR_02170 [Candidatus Kuenenia stuttgartiensis]